MSTDKPHDPKAPTSDSPLATQGDLQKDDDLIVAPTGKSRTRFLMTFLLVIILLTTFTVTGPLLTALTGGDMPGEAYLTWEVEGQPRSMDAQDFMTEKRKLAPIGGFLFGANDGRAVTDEETARFIVIDDVADAAGVRVADTDLLGFIERSFPAGVGGNTADQYKQFLRSYRLSAKEFEAMLRRALRYVRYQQLLSAALNVPDIAAVEKSWRGQHQEFRLEGLAISVVDSMVEARAQAPQGADLQAWFDALSQPEKDAYKTQDAASAELAVAAHGEGAFAGEALWAKYPLPADQTEEQLARKYHQDYGFTRFRRASFPDGMVPSIENLILPFDEVKADATREAKAYYSLAAWLKDMKEREAKGEAVDFGAEATALGLAFRSQTDVLTLDSWNNLGLPAASRYAFEAILYSTKTGLLDSVTVDQKGLVVSKVLQKNSAAMPPFDQIADRVTEAWAKKKAQELALAKLNGLHERFIVKNADGTPGIKAEADEASFVAAATELGLVPTVREWAERPTGVAKEGENAFDTWLRNNFAVWSQTEKTVLRAEMDREGSTAWLVRVAGVRDPQLSRMGPGDLASVGRMTTMTERSNFMTQQVSGQEALTARYKLKLNVEQPQ